MGGHLSQYNVMAKVPGEKNAVIVNLFRGTCGSYSPMECYLLSIVEELDEKHPMLERFAKRGLIVDFDERQALESLGRQIVADSHWVSLAIQPANGCHFDCSSCLESHWSGIMGEDVQDHVIALSERLLQLSKASVLEVVWFGGEPLRAASVIEKLSERLMSLAEKHQAEYDARMITSGCLFTSDNVKLLHRCQIRSVQITLDDNDVLLNKVVDNPRYPLPFKVSIWQNVHEQKQDEGSLLKQYFDDLASKSGNQIVYHASLVLCWGNLADEESLCSKAVLAKVKGMHCAATRSFLLLIDETGRLCHCWDPANPIITADHPDQLSCFLNATLPIDDAECMACLWLPVCAGGCPLQRKQGRKQCFPYKDKPKEYALELYGQMMQKRGKQVKTAVGSLYVAVLEKDGMFSALRVRENLCKRNSVIL